MEHYTKISRDIRVFVNKDTRNVSIFSYSAGKRVLLDYKELKNLSRALVAIEKSWEELMKDD